MAFVYLITDDVSKFIWKHFKIIVSLSPLCQNLWLLLQVNPNKTKETLNGKPLFGTVVLFSIFGGGFVMSVQAS